MSDIGIVVVLATNIAENFFTCGLFSKHAIAGWAMWHDLTNRVSYLVQ